MTTELSEIIQRCTASAGRMQPTDLFGIAQLHSDLQAVRMLSNNDSEGPNGISTVAQRAADLLEKLVLNEATDAVAALTAAGEQIRRLHEFIRTPLEPNQPAPSLEKAISAGPQATVDVQEREIRENDVGVAMDFVGESLNHLDTAEASLLILDQDPTNTGEINTVFRAFHTIKGIAGFLELKQIGALAHTTEAMLELARKQKLNLTGQRMNLVLESRDALKEMVGMVELAAKARKAPATFSGLASLLQKLQAATSADEKTRALLTTSAASPAGEVVTKSSSQTGIPSASNLTTGDSVVKVTTTRLDALINAVGELVIAQAMVAKDLEGPALAANPRLTRNLSQMGKIARGLQDLSMSMRMVPVAGVFQKMARLVRDASHNVGKEINFVTIGSDTELDRNVVDAMSDPLIHMVRNAVDHGLESAEDRVKAGKVAQGTITLRAAHHAGSVVVEISDDGRGLDRERIVEKAVAAGLVQEGQDLTEQEIFELIFHPGLSTASLVTEMSGRGVGMDVVLKNVEALRGRIEIASAPEKGSTFTIRLPLTLAVIDGLIAKVGSQRYIIPITSIEQSIRPTAIQISTVQNRGELCLVRDKLLPIIRLHKLFGVPSEVQDPTAALLVVVQDGPNRCCLLVEELLGQQQVVIKSVGREMGNMPGVTGCAILGDGNVSLILDVGGILNSAFAKGKSR
jgi:two-component system chemotaxis sensor kinase CheA